jgi:hypothetical protein
MFRPKKCMKCGGKPKMQLAGEVQCPPGFKSDGFGNCIPDEAQKINFTDYTKLPSEKINIPPQPLIKEEDVVGPPPINEPVNQPVYKDRIDEGIAKGIISGKKDEDGNEGNARDQYNAIHEEKDKEPQPKLDPYWLFRGFRNGMSWLSGMVERGRQNRYDWMQQTALGQMNPMPTDDFQPNPYNLYMQKGGNLKTIIKEYNKYTNKAQMDMGDGKLDDKGMMKKGGYEIDRMIITRKILPQLLQLGRLGTSKYRNMKKGGIHINPENKGKFTASAKEHGMGVQEFAEHVLSNKEEYSPTQVKRANFARNASKWNRKAGGLTPNKARQILHDKEIHGKPLTDKQRRYFGAMSKGHTNFRGK